MGNFLTGPISKQSISMKRSPAAHILLLMKGMGMGAADVIPGVSGGTIAFISGIYEELISSIRSVNGQLFKTLFGQGMAAAWKQVNGNFLAAVFGGILLSIFSLARVISWLLQNHQMLVWAFFFGLIIGSAIFVGKKIKNWHWGIPAMFISGSILAYYVTIATPATTPEATWFVFLAGCIAISAMILPGISGSFILLLLGKYEYILQAVNELKVVTLMAFAAGCVVGLVSFSNVIGWLFKKHHNATLALLSGFMIGSLNKLWPRKQVLEFRENSAGEMVPFMERSISPALYESLYGQDPQLMPIIICALAGLLIVVLFEQLTKTKTTQA